ncbi:MAG: hypothetical protein K2X39_06375 [Silvanigrellaceae bacterium]|nr:hypothetical protein [Silvanigrellaceae bacterium]
MPNKEFSDRLNKELDNIGVPPLATERIEVFSKLIKIPRFQAESLLNGTQTPNETILQTLAKELDVNAQWLLGKDESRHKKAAQRNKDYCP